MKVVFGGTRGTSCIADPAFMAYGGDTTCVLVVGRRGELLILDAGTGLRRITPLLRRSERMKSATLLMTHFHLDHIMGLPSFALLYQREAALTLGAMRRNGMGCREMMHRLMAQPIWPVEAGDLDAAIHFVDLEAEENQEPVYIGGLQIRWCKTPHPGGSTAYRVEEDGVAFVFATDIEWSAATPQERDSLKRLCITPFPANCFAMDGQFTREEYAAFKGWGHGTFEEVAELATEWGLANALVTHHSPHRNDQQLQQLEERAREKYPSCGFARDGLEIIL